MCSGFEIDPLAVSESEYLYLRTGFGVNMTNDGGGIVRLDRFVLFEYVKLSLPVWSHRLASWVKEDRSDRVGDHEDTDSMVFGSLVRCLE